MEDNENAPDIIDKNTAGKIAAMDLEELSDFIGKCFDYARSLPKVNIVSILSLIPVLVVVDISTVFVIYPNILNNSILYLVAGIFVMALLPFEIPMTVFVVNRIVQAIKRKRMKPEQAATVKAMSRLLFDKDSIPMDVGYTYDDEYLSTRLVLKICNIFSLFPVSKGDSEELASIRQGLKIYSEFSTNSKLYSYKDDLPELLKIFMPLLLVYLNNENTISRNLVEHIIHKYDMDNQFIRFLSEKGEILEQRFNDAKNKENSKVDKALEDTESVRDEIQMKTEDSKKILNGSQEYNKLKDLSDRVKSSRISMESKLMDN